MVLIVFIVSFNIDLFNWNFSAIFPDASSWDLFLVMHDHPGVVELVEPPARPSLLRRRVVELPGDQEHLQQLHQWRWTISRLSLVIRIELNLTPLKNLLLNFFISTPLVHVTPHFYRLTPTKVQCHSSMSLKCRTWDESRDMGIFWFSNSKRTNLFKIWFVLFFNNRSISHK